MPALNGKDRAAARLLVAAVVTLLALFVPPGGLTSALDDEAGPRAGSANSIGLSGSRPIVLRQARGHTAPALALRSVPATILPAAQLVTGALIGLGVVATVVDRGPRWSLGQRPTSRAPPAAAA